MYSFIISQPRATTAPADISSERVPDSWYRQPQQPKVIVYCCLNSKMSLLISMQLPTSVAPGPPPGEPPAIPAGVRYMPMPAGPVG